MISTSSQMCYYWLTALKTLEKPACYFMDYDPAHYFTAPGLSWDAALKMTKVKLELLTDVDMHLMVEKGEYFILVSILTFVQF